MVVSVDGRDASIGGGVHLIPPFIHFHFLPHWPLLLSVKVQESSVERRCEDRIKVPDVSVCRSFPDKFSEFC